MAIQRPIKWLRASLPPSRLPMTAAVFPLRGLEADASYVVTDVDHPDQEKTLTGKQLMEEGLEVRLDAKPAAAIVRYVRK